ncbi:Hypothetical protein I595_952 [Croceitalea dokdonensis DOKDO 023]|uniref:Lipoprotein n=1 Tax=Croceitalea dokdonensis DOKDO 023 TaxID=1300341 RepID=A0A0P7B2M4_9FLAO|nr:hypothetical protein [Croceitalea dokdonensis]KPM32534.1 Hypothetical protein I595_952 [Croceitalea dokdonensis DOKDO 023]
MKKTYIALLGSILILASCKMQHKSELEHQLITLEDGLSAGQVYVHSDIKALAVNTFQYGQWFDVRFANVSGFTLEQGDMFPDLDITVFNTSGEIILKQESLLGGLSQPEDAVLYGTLTLANPILSGQSYKAVYRLYDTKSDHELQTEMDFELLPDSQITITPDGLMAKEVYLFNSDTNSVLFGSNTPKASNISMDFQLLEGYQKKNGRIQLGMYTQLVDSRGRVLTENKDALPNFNVEGITNDQVLKATLSLNNGRFNSPLRWTVRLWDKNSAAAITATATLNIENN